MARSWFSMNTHNEYPMNWSSWAHQVDSALNVASASLRLLRAAEDLPGELATLKAPGEELGPKPWGFVGGYISFLGNPQVGFCMILDVSL